MNRPALSITTLRPGRAATGLALRAAHGIRNGSRDAATATTPACGTAFPGVDFRPAAIVSRQTAIWGGLSGEVVRINEQEAFECDYCGLSHLLIAYQRAARHDGDSILEDLPRSKLRDLSGKLTFVPAGSRFHERHNPSGPVQATYLYLDPRGQLMDAVAGFTAAQLPPRLFFDSRPLWESALKLAALVEIDSPADLPYAEALGVVLTYELLRLDGTTPSRPPVQGGLADWQRRAVAQYIEENFTDQIPLATLAEIARLSLFHFSRAFKRSFGIPPRRYHMNRRIDWAKMLLTQQSLSVTDIAFQVGFADTSSFSVAFRNLVGQSPREYRRSLL